MSIENITNTRLKEKYKWLVILGAIITLLADFCAIISLAAGGLSANHLAFPIVLFIFDVILLVVAMLSNFRFKHSLIIPIIYSAFTAVIIASISAYYYGAVKAVLFTDLMFALLILVHIFSCASLIVSAINAAGSGDKVKIVAICLIVLMAMCAGAWLSFVITRGFFGQGDSDGLYKYENRTLAYTYNEYVDGYEVTGVLDGKGSTVVIPKTFNNKNVFAVNCGIFADDSLSTVILQSVEPISFTSPHEFDRKSSDIKIYADRSVADSYRNDFYEKAVNAVKNGIWEACDGLIDLANSIIPSLNENEVYVAFDYTYDSLIQCKGQILKTWIGEKGSKFSIQSYSQEIEYVKHSNMQSEYDLCWSYRNMDGYIFNITLNESNENIDGQNIASSITTSAAFSRIYAVQFGNDNDTKYELPENVRSFEFDGESTGYRYVTSANANYLIDSVVGRNGFDLAWQYSNNGSATKNDMSELSQVLQDEITVYPVWTLQNPTITVISSDAVQNTIVYGDDVAMTVVATSPAEDLSLRYNWFYNGKNLGAIGGNSTLTKTNVFPSEAGEYSVIVTCYSENTSLISQAESKINLTVNKKQLSFNWTLPENTVYSATYKPIVVAYNAADVINSDKIEFVISPNSSVRDAGRYNFQISLSGTCNDLYEIASGSATRTLEITPYHVSIDWGETEHIYDGDYWAPFYSVTGIDGETIPTQESAGYRNAGVHNATVVTNTQNYVLNNPSIQYHILQKEVTLDWQNDMSFEYDGDSKGILADIIGLVEGETDTVNLIYSGYEVNCGTHTMTAALPNDSNYKLSSGESGNNYSITQKPVTLVWDRSEFVYNSQKQTPQAVIVGLVKDDVVELTYTPDVGVNFGDYEVNANLPTVCNYRFDDDETGAWEFSITKCSLTVEVDNKNKIYDGNVYSDYTVTVVGLQGNDTLQQIAAVSYSGAATTAVNVGDYTISLVLTQGDKWENYDVSTESGTLTVNAKAVTLTWQSNRSFEYDGSVKSIAVTGINGLVGSDTLSIDEYGGEGINAGTHTMTATLPIGNYLLANGQGQCNYTIEKKPLTLRADDKAKVYDGGVFSGYTVTVMGLASTDSMDEVGSVSYGGNSQQGRNVGNYTISPSISRGEKYDNYRITLQSGTLTVTAKPVTLNWTNATPYTYNGGVQSPNATTLDLESDGATLVFTYYSGSTRLGNAPVNVGAYKVEVSLNSNYDLFGTVVQNDFAIQQKVVSLNWTNATPYIYSRTPQSPVAATSDLVSGDGSLITYSYVNGLTNLGASAPSTVGSYIVTASVDSNYKFATSTVTSASYDIEAKPINVNWTNLTPYIYDGSRKTPTATVSGVISGDAVSLIYSYKKNGAQTGNTAPTAVGDDYSVTVASGNPNYVVANATEDFVINAKTLTVSWSNASPYTYNGSRKTPTATVSGAVYGDTVSLTYTYSKGGVQTGSTAPIAVGDDYSVTVSTSNKNYALTNASIAFTIKAKPLTLNWSNATPYVYDRMNKMPTATLSDLVNGDSVNLTYTYYKGSDNIGSVAPCNAGAYTVVAAIDSDNYILTNASVEFDIMPANLTLTWESDEEQYSGQAKPHAATVHGVLAGDEGSVTIRYEYYAVEQPEVKLETAPLETGSYIVKAVGISSENYELSGTVQSVYQIVGQLEELPDDPTNE